MDIEYTKAGFPQKLAMFFLSIVNVSAIYDQRQNGYAEDLVT